ncbi:MAG: DUF4185 domain-containing protein [Geodermatophilaceae bacterium]|nr:DUF4185 domain-containing protein [Geodermatophilaceae bacterium]MDQ3464028.1 DUF4185 domain-containing protein [Actinomycetota bacterium]
MALLVAALPALATPAGAAPSPTTPSGAASAGIAPDAAAVANIAVPAPEWGALFERRSGWTGADGIYSIPLSGNERPGSGAATRTFFTFSDTFIGQVNAAGERVSGATLVNNTNALLAGSDPDPAEIDFFWRTSASGSPMAQVIPQPPTGTRTWFWPNDGIVVDGRLYLFSLRMKEGGDPVFIFAVDGVSLLRTASAAPPFGTYQQTDAPLYLPPAGSRGETTYGMAVLPNTQAAGAPQADGYLYVYGVRNDSNNKKLVVARVLPGQIANFSAYRFWSSGTWSTSIAAATPVTGRISSEFSVSPLPDGRYILVFQLDTLSNKVAVRYADTPVGPWSDFTVVYTAPESGISPNTYTYNAKAHPHLSTPDRLLISYNVNIFDFFEHFSNADIYRPRFIWLPQS